MEKLRQFFKKTEFLVLFAGLSLAVDVVGSFNRTVLAFGILLLTLLVGVVLLFCDDIIPALGSSLVACLAAARCYDAYPLFMGRPVIFATLPVAAFTIAALIFNVIHYRRPIRAGRSVRGIVAVSVAVTLGGLGSIPFADYLSAIYYVVFLGVGMVALYLVFKSRLYETEGKSLTERLAVMLCVIGLFAAVLTVRSFAWDLGTIIKNGGEVPDWKFRNNFSTFMMISMPAPLVFARKRPSAILLTLAIYLSMILLGSRGGLFMGTAELVLCTVFMSVADRKRRIFYIGALVLFALAAACAAGFVLDYFSSRTGGGLISSGEQRARLLVRSFEDFLNAPIFGQGLGYKGNYDVYTPKTGAMGWYHMMIPQIIGSMGTVGILAYGYQFFNRMKLVLLAKDYRVWVLCLCYSGLFLMSQVNPGEFCPFPYELLAVIIFAVVEGDRPALNKKTA